MAPRDERAVGAASSLSSAARLVRALALVGVAILGWVGIAAWHPWPRSGADRVKHAVKWPGDCERVDTTSPSLAPEVKRWSRATASATVSCEFLGPFVMWARFPDRAALRADLLANSSSAPACIAGTEVVLSELDERQRFPDVCRRLDGDLIDVVSPPEEIPTRRTERRDRQAQGRALRRFLDPRTR